MPLSSKPQTTSSPGSELLSLLPRALVKPRMIDAAGDPSFAALTSVPPFIFRNVTARVFSLPANVTDRLREIVKIAR